MRKIMAVVGLVLGTAFCTFAGTPPVLEMGLYDGRTLQPSTLPLAFSAIKPGTIVLLGEMHGVGPVRDQHLEFLNALRSQAIAPISVGMEFVNYTDQSILNEFSSGAISEADFLQMINWKGFDFDFYRQQILFPQWASNERVVGINLSRTITSQIAKNGMASLTPEQLQLMPPQFTIGRNSYRERFFAAMGMHPTPQLENYFIAQSAWDDTMAWQTVDFMKTHSDHIFVIIVGEFHVQYGGGLPDRLRARLAEEKMDNNLLSISQIYTEDMSPEEISKEMQPSPEEGPRADFIWLSTKVPTGINLKVSGN